jgi:hypothetical protein
LFWLHLVADLLGPVPLSSGSNEFLLTSRNIICSFCCLLMNKCIPFALVIIAVDWF